MSNLLVQNIKHTNNTTSMAIDTSGQVSVRGEGSATTTNLQQGLAKAWCDLDGNASTVVAFDSFNVASVDDDGTGLYSFHLTASMGNSLYSLGSNCSSDGSVTTSGRSASAAVEDANSVLIGMRDITNNTATDAAHIAGQVFGDLA